MYSKNDSVDIWYIIFDKFNLHKIKSFFILLNDEEKNKANSFRKDKDKNNYIISHGCLRMLLTKYYPETKAEEWEFTINKYGKPALSKKHKIQFFFNLSHTHSCAAIIFDKFFECGIDIEEDRNLILNDTIINLVLNKKEQALYNNVINKKYFFYKLWVLKEAYVKAIGIGIYQNFEKIDFSSIKKINIQKDITFFKNNYQFGVWSISKNIWVSYCIINDEAEKNIRIIWNDFLNDFLKLYQ